VVCGLNFGRMGTWDKPRFRETFRDIYMESMGDMPLRILLGKLGADWMKIAAEIVCLDRGLEIIDVLENPLDVFVLNGACLQMSVPVREALKTP
jgi:hypothetical protein